MLEGLIGAGVGALGSVISSAVNNNESRAARDWQERMANTAHQREVQDLRAAGLNPILGFSKGLGGAATPTPNVVRMDNPLQDAASNYSAAQGARLNAERLELEKAINAKQLQVMDADQNLKNAQAGAARSQGENIAQDTLIKSLFEANPERAGLLMTLLQKDQLVKESQVEANKASAAASNYSTQVRSPMEVLGKVLESTIKGTGDLSIQSIIRRVLGIQSSAKGSK